MILDAVRDYDISKIFIAIPTATALQRREILDICKESGCEVKLLPGLYQFTDDEVSLADMRNVSVEDLLGREPIKVNEREIVRLINGRVVLVTGAAGSIGSELCRLIVKNRPSRLVAVDINENGLFYLMQELKMAFPDVRMDFLMGSVRDYLRVEEIFGKYHPEIVFHAAGHKHLTMVEASPLEAVKNNIAGTYNVAYAALAYGCKKFILLSTDKAVNPVSILGASSRVCEILMQMMELFSTDGKIGMLRPPKGAMQASAKPVSPCTDFTSIRFGTVIGSEGSVFQVFRKQIEAGGPVLVTHPDVTRFCMSIKDTAHLILEAASYGGDGEVLVLDMGEPYSIDDIARRLIRLCGLVPDSDISIRYTGLREGEKLREEPLMWEEGMRRTSSPSIYIANPTKIDYDAFIENLDSFFIALDEKCDDVQSRLEDLCGSYKRQDGNSPDVTVRINDLQEPIDNLGRIAERFDIPGEVIAAVPMNKGYINRTYRVDARQPDGTVRNYTLQRINTNVFKDAKALMDNFAAVTTHLANVFRLPARPESPANQCIVRSKDGAAFVEDSFGAWRMLTYFPNVHSYDIPESAEVFRNAGMAFGTFLKAISTLPASACTEVIPNFHNTPMRFEALEQAVSEDVVGRVANIGPELEFLRSHRQLFSLIADALESGEIPTRLCHNDCNLNNVLFEDGSNQPVAVIDLDTVMPSTPLYDFGDSIRIGTNTAKDDEKDLSKVSCNLGLLEEYARGWLGACGTMLTKREWELLPYAPLIITSEDGIRFLMDYIQGDKYYYTSYKGQNLDRARTQLHLLKDMETKLPKIKEIISNIATNLK